jgi:hypothetical protein
LIGGENQIEDEGAELLVADDLFQVERLETVAFRQSAVAVLIELDADGVGKLRLDHFPYQVGRFSRDVRRPYHDEFASAQLYATYVGEGACCGRLSADGFDPCILCERRHRVNCLQALRRQEAGDCGNSVIQ